MRRAVRVAFVAAMALSTFACSQQSAPSTSLPVKSSQPPEESDKDYAALKQDIAHLKTEVAVLKARFEGISDPTAELDPTSGQFTYYDRGITKLAILVEHISQIGDGAKLRLRVGNLTSANIADAKFSVRYGTRSPGTDDANKFVGWLNGLKKAEFSSVITLKAGAWTTFDATLPDIKADTLGYIAVDEVSATNISLHAR